MNFFKRAIAHILAITVALSGAMIASAKNLNKSSKDKKIITTIKKRLSSLSVLRRLRFQLYIIFINI